MKRNYFTIAVICGLLSPFMAMAYSDWSGATAQPPNNNPDGPVWLQSGSPVEQTGEFKVSGMGIIGDNLEITENVKAINLIPPGLVGEATLNMGSWGEGGVFGYNLDIYGNINVRDFDGSPPYIGRINVNEICLNNSANDTNCRNDWPGEASDIWVNTTGDTMTGKLIINAGTDYGLESTTNGVASYAISGVNTLSGAGGGGIFASCIGGNCDSVRAETTGGGAGVYGASTAGRGVFGTGTTGVLGSGTTQGGWFVDSDSADDGEAILGNGDWGVEGKGSVVGGWFHSISDSGNVYIGASDTGIQAYGDDYAGYFKDSLDSGKATLGYGDVGIEAYGDNHAGYFKDSNDSGVAYLGIGDVGISAAGDGNAGIFNGGLYGVDAIGTSGGGKFADKNSTGIGIVGYGSRSFYAEAGSLDINDKDLLNVHGFQLKDWDDDTGGTDDKYRLLARDGAWQFYNGGVVVGNYANGTWTDLANGNLVVEGQVRVGTTAAIDSEPLQVYQNDTGTWLATFANTNATCHISSSAAVTCSSDARLKDNINPFNKGLNEVMQLNPVTFTWKNDPTKLTYTGFLAQDVQQVMPELVESNEDGYFTLDKTNMIPYLVNSIKELKAQNDELRSRVEALEAK